MDLSRKWLVDFNTEKIKFVSFDWSNNTGAIDVSLFLRKNHLLRCWGCFSPINWNGDLLMSLLLKPHTGKLEL